jgi:hypothetical protein
MHDSSPKPWNGPFAKKNKALLYFDSFQMVINRFSSTVPPMARQMVFSVLLEAVVDISV